MKEIITDSDRAAVQALRNYYGSEMDQRDHGHRMLDALYRRLYELSGAKDDGQLQAYIAKVEGRTSEEGSIVDKVLADENTDPVKLAFFKNLKLLQTLGRRAKIDWNK